jgi:L-ascorbate metabolism protein UlaG (beta-lactamase superfamily)
MIIFIVEIITLIYLLFREFGKTLSVEESTKRYGHLSYFYNGKFHPAEEPLYEPKKVTKSSLSKGSLYDIISMIFHSFDAPKQPFPQLYLKKSSFPPQPENFSLYWLGHSSTIIEINNKRLIIDPVLDNASPIFVGVPRYTKRVIERDNLPDLDYIIITHNHYDHLERKTVISFKKGHFIVPLGIKYTLEGWGIKSERITELGWGDIFEDDFIKIIAEEAQHFSGRYLLDQNRTLFNSYLILGKNNINIFWSGDTGYQKHFKRISEQYNITFDLIALEMDAYNTGWRNCHLFPKEVIKAALDLKATKLFPIHWAVFDLAFHPWHESIDLVIKEAENTGINIITPMLGEKINLDTITKSWWNDQI